MSIPCKAAVVKHVLANFDSHLLIRDLSFEFLNKHLPLVLDQVQ